MRQDVRAPFAGALEDARRTAYPVGEYVGQESFMRAADIRRLAERAGIGPDVTVLDLCCGVAGPGRLITAETGCDYLGLDYSADALAIARELAGDLPCRFQRAHIPPLPDVRVDVVLLLATMLAFPDKPALLAQIVGVLRPGGRFACTLEAGSPLTDDERAWMPDADTVHLMRPGAFADALAAAGLTVTWCRDATAAQRETAAALLAAFRADAAGIARGIGRRALQELLVAHELWVDWLGSGRVCAIEWVAERR